MSAAACGVGRRLGSRGRLSSEPIDFSLVLVTASLPNNRAATDNAAAAYANVLMMATNALFGSTVPDNKSLAKRTMLMSGKIVNAPDSVMPGMSDSMAGVNDNSMTGIK